MYNTDMLTSQLPMRACPYGHTIREADDIFPRHSEATLIELDDGDWLLYWSRFGTERVRSGELEVGSTLHRRDGDDLLDSDNDVAVVAGTRSSDKGDSWTEDEVIVANPGGVNVMHPALARLSDGALGLLVSRRDSPTEARRVFRRSTDEGRTWSDPVDLTHDGYVGGTHDRFTIHSTGRLLAPLHEAAGWYDHYLWTRLGISDDGGRTWRVSGAIASLPGIPDAGESGAWEPGIVERADGSLLLVLRTAMGTLFRAESHDRGDSWTPPTSMEVTSPVAPGRLERIPGTDDLVLFWNWHYDPSEPMGGYRRPLACAVSRNGGRSWPLRYRRVLEDAPGRTYGYPSCRFIGGEAVITYYEAEIENPFGKRDLKLMRIPVSWLYDGDSAPGPWATGRGPESPPIGSP